MKSLQFKNAYYFRNAFVFEVSTQIEYSVFCCHTVKTLIKEPQFFSNRVK